MKQLSFFTTRKRYPFSKVLLWSVAVSFALFLFVYLSSVAVGTPFNWKAYREYLLNQSLGTLATAVLFYFSLNHFHRLFQQRKRFVHFLLPCILIIVSVEVYNIAVDTFLPLSNNVNNQNSLSTQVIGNLFIAIPYAALSLLIAYINNLRDERKKHQLLQEQKLKLEVEKMQADLKFLKSQINPHFLHNTLNSFYARSLPLSRDLADGILTLSEMMRYALGEAYTPDGKVLLQDEIEHLKNVLKIHQFRFRNHLHVQLNVKGEMNGAVIIPFVLITLVENIFKHADLNDPDYPVVINIEIGEGQLRYHSCNKKKSGPKELSTGIGLDNVKKRLDYTYGTGYALTIRDEAETYTTELIIHNL